MPATRIAVVLAAAGLLPATAYARAVSSRCKGLPTYHQLAQQLAVIVKENNGGIFKPNAMWATVVNRAGDVCVVAKVGDAWPGSRLISAAKANTANAFSNDRLALSTANLYSAVQPGGSLYGLATSNPLNIRVAYKGPTTLYGKARDPLIGNLIGGINVFGGGLALYDKDAKLLGGLGVSGDSSCTDHVIAWKLRNAFDLAHVPAGVSPAKNDNIIYDLDATTGKSASGFGHPVCGKDATEIAKSLVLPGVQVPENKDASKADTKEQTP